MSLPVGSATALQRALLGLLLCAVSLPEPCWGQSPRSSEAERMFDYLQDRVASQPEDGSAWRLLGRMYRKTDENQKALAAFGRAVELEPDNAAAHFDLAELLMERKDTEAAADHLGNVVELAPESVYAKKARTYLADLPPSAGQQEILQAGFEVKRFDRSETVEDDVLPQTREGELAVRRPFYFRLESGAVYNTNVALAPISRALFPDDRASFQGFVSPDFEYWLVDGTEWRAGPSFRGYFNLNEGGFREFNLQSYQPGLFVERVFDWKTRTVIPRLQYEFSHDEFDGETFGNRHALTASALTLWSETQASSVFWTIDHTEFLDDGVLPSITSQDGLTNTLSFSHTLFPERRHLRSVSAGVDLQRADTRGTNFSYNGISLYATADLPLTERFSLWLHGGWGYRDYFDFEFSPSRNENIWQAGAELRRRISDEQTVALVFHYDRFDSDNRLFEAERIVSGVEWRFEY